jgi:hypothetical protein
MLREYLATAMKRAKYEILSDDGTTMGRFLASKACWPTPRI